MESPGGDGGLSSPALLSTILRCCHSAFLHGGTRGFEALCAATATTQTEELGECHVCFLALGQACLEFQWHHHIPTDIVRKPFIEVCGDLNVAAVIMCSIHVLWSSQMGSQAVPLILGSLKLFMAYFGQFSHRTAHDFKCTSPFAKGLQRVGLMISQQAHKAHHKPPHDMDYCLVGVCNRPMDALRKAIRNDHVWLVIFGLWTVLDIKLLSWAVEALMGTPPALTVTSVIEYMTLVEESM